MGMQTSTLQSFGELLIGLLWVMLDGLGGRDRLVDVRFAPKAPKLGQAGSVAAGRMAVIRTPRLGARTMRHELADCEWAPEISTP